MNRLFRLTAASSPPVSLRTIGPGDLEELRNWKNANKQAFFFKDEISPAMQKAWFEGYRARPEDFMFVVESGGRKAGCMGFRLQGPAADCYNIIGLPEAAGKGILRAAMTLMCSYIRGEHAALPGCRVLKANPAVGWYEKCGYRVVGEASDHFRLELDAARFKPCAYSRAEGSGVA